MQKLNTYLIEHNHENIRMEVVSLGEEEEESLEPLIGRARERQDMESDKRK